MFINFWPCICFAALFSGNSVSILFVLAPPNPIHPDPKSSRAGCKSHLSISCWQVTRSATRSASYLPLLRKCVRFVCSALFSFFRLILDPPIALAFAHPCICILLFSSLHSLASPHIRPYFLLPSFPLSLLSPPLFFLLFTSLHFTYYSFHLSQTNRQINPPSPLAASDPTPFFSSYLPSLLCAYSNAQPSPRHSQFSALNRTFCFWAQTRSASLVSRRYIKPQWSRIPRQPAGSTLISNTRYENHPPG